MPNFVHRLANLNRVSKLLLIATASVVPTTLAQAQWVVTNLHPSGAFSSRAYTVNGGKQAGDINTGLSDSTVRATFWSGSADSAVSFHPSGANSSRMAASVNGQQVGFSATTQTQAVLWSGDSASLQNLHPPGYRFSMALCTDGSQQGGQVITGTSGLRVAAVWSGTSSSCVLLAPPGVTDSAVNGVHSGQQGGFVQFGSFPSFTSHAAVWNGSSGSMVILTPGTQQGVSYGSVYNVHAGRQCGVALTGSRNSAALWSGTPGSLVTLTAPGDSFSAAHGLYNQHVCGQATFTESGGVQRTRAAYWNSATGEYQNLHALLGPEFNYSIAYGVYEDSSGLHVVGVANGPQTPNRAIMWSVPTTPPPCGPADVGKAGGLVGHDGALDNNDFVVFISLFFNLDSLADRGVVGGVPGSDNAWDNNDLIVFVNQFFDGC